jgi:hypothetical protein
MSEMERTLRECSSAGPNARFGAVTFIQHLGSTLNAHPHFHSCVMDGLFELEDGVVVFKEASPTAEDIRSVQVKVRKRVLRLYRRHGVLTYDEAKNMLVWQNGGGFSLDASVRIEADDRSRLERLIRYCARPPFSGERLRAKGDGKFLYIPKKPGAYGRGAMSMTAPELLEKLSALIPRPRRHSHHYHGVFVSGSSLRKKVVALVRLQPLIARSEPPDDAEPKPKSSYSWAKLIARIYETLPLVCPRCSGTMRIIAFIEEVGVIVRILIPLGEPAEQPSPVPARLEREENFDDPFPEDYP